MRVSVDTFAIAPVDAQTPAQVVFLDTPTTATVTLTAAALPSTQKHSLTYDLPSEQWWDHLMWTATRDGDARPTPIEAVFLDGRNDNGGHARTLRAGEHAVAHFRLQGLTPGAYTLRVHLGALTSGPERFLASTGTESAAVA